MPTDIEIAQSCTPKPIAQIAAKAGIPEEAISPYDVGEGRESRGQDIIEVKDISPTVTDLERAILIGGLVWILKIDTRGGQTARRGCRDLVGGCSRAAHSGKGYGARDVCRGADCKDPIGQRRHIGGLRRRLPALSISQPSGHDGVGNRFAS